MNKLLLCGLAALVAGCGSAPDRVRPAAADAEAAAPGAPYRSALEGYAGFREQELADWRAVNDEVGKVGGHKGALQP